ncbi:MAG: hypothetical protein UX10_C0031G0008 [Candidatus Magasanikbacteria bacterium GW2011_GWA2_45_39]|uniref:Purine nucleoside phosphorylase n=1 Tax=Candidatus Magasanikbacteria bacterium GW2011_GWA2_45_39 TaxID=1619041 RepID=A0A0G1MEG1_9BACT|nr:MAG: hypothetical protein UX10_C0031G0008 [Candidatus Magasanikbacteria bacterium GW2011_GWA2_45_39]
MLTFFQQFPEIIAVLSEKKDGSMKVFLERPEENQENREKFFQEQGIDAGKVVSAEIVHGTKVEIIDSQKYTDKQRPLFIGISSFDRDEQMILGIDGLATKEKNVFLSVTIADCLPVFFYDPVAEVIGIAHAGWRGIVDGVIEKTVAALVGCGASQKNLFVSFGPSIQKCHFEIGMDILPRFAGFEKYVIKKDGRILVDLSAIVKEQLRSLGILEKHIETSSVCTFCEPDLFFSYRRDKPQKIEAMVAVIGING